MPTINLVHFGQPTAPTDPTTTTINHKIMFANKTQQPQYETIRTTHQSNLPQENKAKCCSTVKTLKGDEGVRRLSV